MAMREPIAIVRPARPLQRQSPARPVTPSAIAPAAGASLQRSGTSLVVPKLRLGDATAAALQPQSASTASASRRNATLGAAFSRAHSAQQRAGTPPNRTYPTSAAGGVEAGLRSPPTVAAKSLLPASCDSPGAVARLVKTLPNRNMNDAPRTRPVLASANARRAPSGILGDAKQVAAIEKDLRMTAAAAASKRTARPTSASSRALVMVPSRDSSVSQVALQPHQAAATATQKHAPKSPQRQVPFARSASGLSAGGQRPSSAPVAAPRPLSPSAKRFPSPAPIPPRKCPHCTTLLYQQAQADEHEKTCAFMPLTCGACDSENPTIKCGFCTRGAAMLQEHQAQGCPFRLVPCPNEGCGRQVSHGSLQQHFDSSCPAQVVRCTLCATTVKRSEAAAHDGVHCTESKVACPLGCGHEVRRSEVAAHIEQHWHDPLHRTRVNPALVPPEHPAAALAQLLSLMHEQREQLLVDCVLDDALELQAELAERAARLHAVCRRVAAKQAQLGSCCTTATLRRLTATVAERVNNTALQLRDVSDNEGAEALSRRWAMAALALNDAMVGSAARATAHQ